MPNVVDKVRDENLVGRTIYGVQKEAPQPVRLQQVTELSTAAEDLIRVVAAEVRGLVGDCDVQHVGATSLPDGLTKGDVDVSIRVSAQAFAAAVQALRSRFAVAQPENWSATFASFADDQRDLPLGLQVTVIGSADDFLVHLRDLFRADPTLRRKYDRSKERAAPLGATAYWTAKDQMLHELLDLLSERA